MKRIVTFNQKGYDGASMSVRARSAYDSGEKPISKFNRSDVLALEETLNNFLPFEVKLKMTVQQLKDFLLFHGNSSWHHTGKFANETQFYSIAYALTDGLYFDLMDIDESLFVDEADIYILEELSNYFI